MDTTNQNDGKTRFVVYLPNRVLPQLKNRARRECRSPNQMAVALVVAALEQDAEETREAA